MNKIHCRRRHRRAFSMVEVTISTGLVVMLSMLLSNAWIGLGRPLLQNAARCHIAQEADLALACLSLDLGGCLPEGTAGVKLANQFVGWTYPDNAELMLCFDSATDPNSVADWGLPDTVVVYAVVGNTLVRSNQATGVEYVAAQNVSGLTVEDQSGDLRILLSFSYRGISQTYTMIAKRP
jgi:hypothetical protein